MVRKGESNLIPTNRRSKEEARELGQKGGKRSGEIRREKKTQKEQLELLLSLPLQDVKDKNGRSFKQQAMVLTGLSEEELDNQMALNIAMFKLVLSGGKGAVQAYSLIFDKIAGQYDKKKDLEIEKQKQEIERLKLEQEKLRQELGQGKDSYEDLTPLAELLKKE